MRFFTPLSCFVFILPLISSAHAISDSDWDSDSDSLGGNVDLDAASDSDLHHGLTKRVIVPQRIYCDRRYGQPKVTACRYAAAQIPVNHNNPDQIQTFRLPPVGRHTPPDIVQLPKIYRAGNCVVRVDVIDPQYQDLTTWAEIKETAIDIKDRCVKERDRGGMQAIGQFERIWVSLYEKGSELDQLQAAAERHGNIMGALALFGKYDSAKDCGPAAAMKDFTGANPSSPTNPEVSISTTRFSQNYCRGVNDCGFCDQCLFQTIQRPNVLYGYSGQLSEVVGTCVSL
ncbi:MAG: hypothetical protein M1827_000425 [Pycnora praestabilis]|nr:MAG: hypothetical protein M1827_000425 [Pycnora praestabilis]